MKKISLLPVFFVLVVLAGCNATVPGLKAPASGEYPADYAGAPRFRALVCYTEEAEKAHVEFAGEAIEFFKRLNYGDGYILETTADFSEYDYDRLKEYGIVVMLNACPGKGPEREAFEKYMENGGGWMGFHAAAYNDKNTDWPWFLNFIGGGVFYCNNWPPQPVLVEVDNRFHPVTKNLPASFVVPESEWYQWKPSPRENRDIEVLVSISPKNYPLGIKDVIRFGDFPVVWTNKNYRMIYLNMGHGNDEFTDAAQKLLFINSFRWVLSRDKAGDPFKR
ncbi:MAG: ThuA domain-containing protein [Proteiniphilum sp.]|jgi:type 1 glutamine amidotransferase|nr:ThuA domain-containing protein [Proteiniphilum sp.]